MGNLTFGDSGGILDRSYDNLDHKTKSLLINAMDTDETNIPDNYLVVLIKVGNKVLRALVDTGAQPCVIKESCVLLGTPIVPSNLYIKGVKGPAIAV